MRVRIAPGAHRDSRALTVVGAMTARTQTDIAAEAKLSIQALASLERGGFRRYDDGPWLVPNPKDETLIRLARALGVDPEEMFKRVGRYDDRPQTTGSRRRQDRKADRITELEAKNAELERRLNALEERVAGYPSAPQARRKPRREPG